MILRTDFDAAAIRRCADLLAEADGLLITAGVDSGLPDFRGTEGFWRAYPALARAQIRFEEIANPRAFARDPKLAWGFYGHRLPSIAPRCHMPAFACCGNLLCRCQTARLSPRATSTASARKPAGRSSASSSAMVPSIICNARTGAPTTLGQPKDLRPWSMRRAAC